jgi:adenylate kinase family enzyme
MRIAIVGNSGSGKSTLAHQLETMYSLAKLDLDTVAWEPDKIAARRDHAVAIADVVKFCDSNQHWVAEGCYASLVQAALQRRPMLVFMEPGVENCLANCRLRPWEPHKYKSKEEQDAKLGFLLSWVSEYYGREDDQSLAAHQALFDGYRGPKRKFTSRVQQNELDDLRQLCRC